MSDSISVVRRAVEAIINAERENLRLCIHRMGGPRAELHRRRDERMDEVYRQSGAVRNGGTDPRFSLDTVEARLKRLVTACNQLSYWEQRMPRTVSFVCATPDSNPGQVAAMEAEALDHQADDVLTELCEGVRRALDGVIDLAAPALETPPVDGPQAAQAQSLSSQPAEGDWQPASEAVKMANNKGYDITLDWISKRKGKLRTRGRHLSGRHQLEVEMRSLARLLFAEGKLKTSQTDTDDPEGSERDQVETRKRTQQDLKRRSLS